MVNIPTINSIVELSFKVRNYYYFDNSEHSVIKVKGVIVANDKWNGADNITLLTKELEYPKKIINVKNVINIKIISGGTTNIRRFKIVNNSKEYTVVKNETHFSCTCIGFKYHAKCKHIEAVKNKLC
jgi:hypothetical protein